MKRGENQVPAQLLTPLPAWAFAAASGLCAMRGSSSTVPPAFWTASFAPAVALCTLMVSFAFSSP